MKKERNLGIDLLKLVLALMIVVNHSIGHGLEQYDAALYENSKIAFFPRYSSTINFDDIVAEITEKIPIMTTNVSPITKL